MATEKELRQNVADWGNSYKGIKEGGSEHKELVNIFNNSGLCTRYKMTTADAWCALFVSDAFIVNGLTGIFPCVECSCAEMITLAKKAGIWVEDDAYTPSIADVILYDWDDSGSGDNTGTPDHVGIVQKISGTSMTVIEGNKSDTVGTRSMTVNGKYIRGYITPNYASVSGTSKNYDATVEPKTVWNYFIDKLGACGTAGLMGNIKAESDFKPINLQDSYESKLGYTDKTYTDAVDSGAYTKFGSDSAGYGLVQWTYSTRKKGLKNYCDSKGCSIGNAEAQLEYIWKELQSEYPSLLSSLQTATSVQSASDSVLTKYEQPADQGSSVKKLRGEYAQSFYDEFVSGTTTKTIDELAQEVCAGKWGNDPERTEALTAAGYDAEAVQARVNEIKGVGGSSSSTTSVKTADKFEEGYRGGVKYKVTAKSGLNMRYGPDQNKYKVIKALSYGATMYYYGYYEKDSSGTKWMLVLAGDQSGWVCSTYVKKA